MKSYIFHRPKSSICTDLYDYPPNKVDKEEIVRFLHARLPCVPIKVIRANTFEPEAKVYRQRSSDGQLIGAVVFKDHDSAEFREVKYFCTAYAGGGIGTRLMTALKLDSVSSGLFYIVLYASNTAVLFFTKNSFLNFPDQIFGLSKTVVLSRVEQYQRSTLMACDLIDLYPNSFKWMKSSQNAYSQGDSVLVSHGLRHARDEEAFVIDKKGSFKIKVRYPKWTSDTDEWIAVGAKRLKKATHYSDDDETNILSTIKKIKIVKKN